MHVLILRYSHSLPTDDQLEGFDKKSAMATLATNKKLATIVSASEWLEIGWK